MESQEWSCNAGKFHFSDTIANNIAVNTDNIDIERLRHAVMVANIREFIDSLPLGYNTKIGMEGNGVSQGQRQRLLIARAVYKNPEYLFFDEATNALDANNEKEIMEHLNEFYKGKTVVVVAHRLSTVRNADKIVVLDKGKVVEEGTHKELTEKKGLYYQLVKINWNWVIDMEEKQYKDIELRSEEVQEVMNKVPPMILRCGIGILATIILVLLIGSALFQYPETIEAELTLTTRNPPVYIKSQHGGRIEKLYITNGIQVKKVMYWR